MKPRPLVLAALLSVGLACPSGAEPVPAEADEPSPEAAAFAVLDAFMAAFNARDEAAWVATLHFPHVRIASGETRIDATAAGFQAGMDFDAFAEATGWHHSAWTSREVIQAGPGKVHVKVRFTRYRADDSVLAVFDSLYVVTRRDGRWGVAARSSFAP